MGVADSTTLHHTCLVVNNIEKAAQDLANTLAIKPWHVWTIEPADCKVHGKDVPFTFRVAIAQVGDSAYELLEPISGESVYVEHLKTKGEGFHHTCLAYPSLEEMRAAKEELLKQNRKMIQFGSLGDAGEFCYFEIDKFGGALELLYLAGLPDPELTIG